MAPEARPFIFVLAGVNGAGKSSVGGARIEEYDLTWYNPDSYAKELVRRDGVSLDQANADAWKFGHDQLVEALEKRANFAFETTLGGNTITALLAKASQTHDVIIWFCGLASADLHLQRVKARVESGGHDIPEAKIRERWNSSRANLIRLLPLLAHLQVFDNSVQVSPGEAIPDPLLVLETEHGRIVSPSAQDLVALARIPDWAMPIVEAALCARHDVVNEPSDSRSTQSRAEVEDSKRETNAKKKQDRQRRRRRR